MIIINEHDGTADRGNKKIHSKGKMKSFYEVYTLLLIEEPEVICNILVIHDPEQLDASARSILLIVWKKKTEY